MNLHRLAVELSYAINDVSEQEIALSVCDWLKDEIESSPSSDEKATLAGLRNVIFNFLNEVPASYYSRDADKPSPPIVESE